MGKIETGSEEEILSSYFIPMNYLEPNVNAISSNNDYLVIIRDKKILQQHRLNELFKE